MFIEPAQYLDLTDRLAVITKKLEKVSVQRQILTDKVVGMHQKIAILQSRIKQMENQKLKTKQTLKQHITSKADEIAKHVSSVKQDEKLFIQSQVNKLRNQSALNKLKILEERITQNNFTIQEKQFCQKIKTLYIINKKKSNCSINQLYQWVSGIINASSQNKNSQIDVLAGVNDSIEKSITKSVKKQKKIIKNQSLINRCLQTIDQNQEKLAQSKKSKGKQNVKPKQNMSGKTKNQAGEMQKQSKSKPLGFLLKI